MNSPGVRPSEVSRRWAALDQQHKRAVEQEKGAVTGQTIVALEQEREAAEATYRKGLLSDLAKAEADAALFAQEEIKAAQRTALETLKAPVDGTVQQLALHTVGGVVTPAQALMVIVPDEAHLEIEATLASRDVGFVHDGQEAEVKVEAFDFTRYGLLHGTVTAVSRDTITEDDQSPSGRPADRSAPGQNRSAADSQAPVYVAHVTVAATGVQTEQGFSPLAAGMAATAEIKTGKRSVISYLLSPLTRHAHESGRER